MAVGTFYGRQVFNPWLVLSQIMLMQTVFYFGYVFVLLILDRVALVEVDILDQMFQYDHINLHNLDGVVSSAGLLLNSVVFVTAAAVFIVGRAKKCLDFTATLFIVHFVICWSYGGFPWQLWWWIFILASLAASALLSEYVCMRRELREIPLSGFPVELASVSTQL